MRLTLRTLLAYLDREHLKNLLSPEESRALEELGTKIGNNEFASGLVERIHGSLGRPRLGAPKLNGRGIGLDPNTVAEFLDNSLHQDRMQEFEKVCLESDVHLAEVAACHQILSLVLAERPDVSQELREKMYQLPHQAQVVSKGGEASLREPVAVTSEPVSDSSRPAEDAPTRESAPPKESISKRPTIDKKSQIPDYLRASRRSSSWKPILAMAALVLLLLTIGLLAMGNLDGSHPVLGPLLADRASAPPPTSSGDDVLSGTPGTSVPSRPQGEQPSSPTPGDPASATAESSDRRRPEINGDIKGAEESTSDEGRGRNGELSRSENGAPENGLSRRRENGSLLPDRELQTDIDPLDDDIPPALTEPADTASRPVPDRPVPPEPSADPFADLARALGSADEPTSGSADEPTRSQPPPPPRPEGDSAEIEAETLGREVGRFIAAERDHMLARWDTERLAWLRLPPRAVLSSGERLVALPSYRPQIALSSGIHIMLVGPAALEFGTPTAGGTASLQLNEGRALLDTSGVAGSQLELGFPGSGGTVIFESSDAALAVEVRPLTQLGQDPGLAEPTMGCEIHLTNGDLTWRDREGNSVALKSGQMLWLSGTSPAVLHDATSPPSWIDARDLREIDLRASRELAQLVDTTRPISLSLFEQVSHRQVEVSALAIESLTIVEEFEPVLTALRNERYQAYWRSLVAALEAAIRRGPDSATMVRAALATQRLEEAPVFYRLLYGFSGQQLSSGGAQELVNLLESPSMEIRILALENLRRITNRTNLYRPEREPAQQRKPLQDWRNTLNRGEITYRTAE